jgi:hypothetical protein
MVDCVRIGDGEGRRQSTLATNTTVRISAASSAATRVGRGFSSTKGSNFSTVVHNLVVAENEWRYVKMSKSVQ